MAKLAKETPVFEDVLDMPSELIERPKPLPRGTYLVVVQGQPEFGKSSEKQTDFAEFKFKVLQPGDDVDEEQLERYLTSPDGSKKKLNEAIIKREFYLTGGAMFMLKDFCKTLGVDVSEGTKPRAWIAETPGRQCYVHVKHKPWRSGDGVTAQIDKIMAVEE